MCVIERMAMTRTNTILLVEDNPDDEELTLRAFRKSKMRRVPVVVLTSSNEERDILSSYDLGANSFVRKPVDFAQFMDAARELGMCWMVTNEPPPK